MRQVFSFPDPVNETSARIVASGVVLQSLAFLLIGSGWLLLPLAYGFVARVLTGPTLSPLGQFATRVVTPRIPGRAILVPGPPKRFAQAIGVGFSGGAAIAWATGAAGVAQVLVLALMGAAALEAGLALCLGCVVYNRLRGCPDCDAIAGRLPETVVAR